MVTYSIIGRKVPVYSDTQTQRENCVNIRRYSKSVSEAEVRGTWSTKNDARALCHIVCANCAFSEAAFGEDSAWIRCRSPQFEINFRSGSCFDHSRAQLYMGQADSINNQTVKLVFFYCVVSKQVEVSTILTSTYTRTCPVFAR